MAEFTYTGENSRLRKSDLKTINGTSIVGSGDIVISGGGSGDTNVIETVKVNGTALTPDANKAVDIPIDVVVVNWYDKFAGNTDFNMVDGDTGSLTTNEISELASLINTNDKYVIIRGATPSGDYIYYKFAYDTGEFWDFVSHALGAKYTLRVDYGGNNTWTFKRRVEGIINGVKVNGTELTLDNSNKVDISVPTKTSDLTNDSNFTTLSEVTLTIVNSAPATLDTLNELAAALGNDVNFATTVATQIGEKYTKPSTGIPASDLAAGVIPDVPVQSVNGQTGAVTVKENVQSDWNATFGDAVILNKPDIPDEKLSSSYQTSTLENDNLLLAGGDTYETAFSKIEKAILDNEETIAASLNDLNTRKIEIDDIPTKTSDLTNDSGFLTSYTETDPTVQSWAKKTIGFGSSAYNGELMFDNIFMNNWPSNGYVISLKNGENSAVTSIYTSSNIISNNGEIWNRADDYSLLTAKAIKDKIDIKYTKPSTGIPKTDLASAVQTSLGLADTALLSHQSIKTLNTNNTTTQTADASETIAGSGTINLHKIAKTGSYNDLLDKPTIPAAVTESTVSGWGFTKNAGTITGITMNGASKGTSGVVDLGTVLTSFTETDPTVPAWAKASTKPTYTAAEVGALPDTYTPPVTSVNGQTGAVSLTIPSAPGTLNTTAITAQNTSSSEALSGNITLHKVAKTGTYSDLIGTPNLSAYVIDYGSSGVGKIHGNVSEIEETRLYAASTTGAYVAVTPGGVDIDTTSLLSFGDVSVTTRTGAKLKYNNNEVATVNQIPTVNNATLTIQKNGTTVDTFTANASSNVTANIQVNELPTVSSSDNGKILQVVNGVWALVTPVTVYTGTSTPNSSLGSNGDLYVLTS